MNRAEILLALQRFKDFKAGVYQIERIGIFGSIARNQASENSDVDVVVLLKKQDLFNIIGIKQDLEETLQSPVDVVSYRENMNKFLKSRIDGEALYV